MQIHFPLKVGQRLAAAMGLVLVLTTLISGLSLVLSQRLDADLLQVDERSLPSVQLVHELALLVEGQRGMAALHLLPHASRDRDALEVRLQASRQTIQRRMTSYEPRVAGAADRQHFDAVKVSLVLFWAAHDRLLAASRLAAAEPAAYPASPALAPALALARSLLTGESQQAFLQLGADLDAWWAFHAQATHRLAQQAHADVQQAVVMLAGLCAVAWLLGVVAWWLVRQMHHTGQQALASAPADLSEHPQSDLQSDLQPDPPPPEQRSDGRSAGPSQAAARAIQTAREAASPTANAAASVPQPVPQPASQAATQPAGQPASKPRR